jgi:hypothetical protein
MTRGVSEVGVKAFIKKANRDPELRGPEISRYGSFIWKGWKVATSDGKGGGLARTKLPEGNGWCSQSLITGEYKECIPEFRFPRIRKCRGQWWKHRKCRTKTRVDQELA